VGHVYAMLCTTWAMLGFVYAACCGPVYAMLFTLYSMLGFISAAMLWSILWHAVYTIRHAGVHLHHHVVFLSMPCCVQPEPCLGSSTPPCCVPVYAMLYTLTPCWGSSTLPCNGSRLGQSFFLLSKPTVDHVYAMLYTTWAMLELSTPPCCVHVYAMLCREGFLFLPCNN
jgi:hypothetical protein